MEAMSRSGSRGPENTPDSLSHQAPVRDPVDQLAEEFVARYRQGERPSVSEYVRHHPEFADQLQEVIQALVLLEELGPGKRGPVQAGQTVEAPAGLERLGEFRIIREVGRGGMGIVYEAEQESLGRRVAIKVLPYNSLLLPDQLARFRREARAAAGLHHSNIVPVFAVGLEAGVHFYAMQFIRGQGLEQVLAEVKRIRQVRAPSSVGACSDTDRSNAHNSEEIARSLLTGQFAPPSADNRARIGFPADSVPLSAKTDTPLSSVASSALSNSCDSDFCYFRSVAQIGVQASEALAYAHNEGVLHRDIKPSNLLLDLAGSVWITDFGLAKTEAHDQLTHTGDLVGTLCYMAPERFSGWSDPRSDIYSLGLTLYEMLTLQRAFAESDHHRLLKRMAQEEPPRPRKLNPLIPRDLETVVLKAMAKEPGARYQAAQELADDLRSFLAGRPIQARRTSQWEHMRLWCRRNPAVAAASALAVFALIVGVAAVSWQWRRAESERRVALANFQKARDAVEECFITVTENPALQEPGMEDARKILLQASLKYYQDFLAHHADDPGLQADLALAHYRIGFITERIGAPADALAAYQQAQTFYQLLSQIHPDDAMLQSKLAQCRVGLGNVYQITGQTGPAEAQFQQAANLYQGLAKQSPDAPEFLNDLANVYQKVGTVYRLTRRPDQAEATLRSALAIRDRLVRAHPAIDLYRGALAADHIALALVFEQLGKRQESERAFRDALDLNNRLAKAHPGSIDYRRELAICYNGLASLYFNDFSGARTRLGEAEAFYLKALALREQIARDHPKIQNYESDLARTHNNMGLLYSLMGKKTRAVEAYGKALMLREQLAEKYPEVVAYQKAVAKTHHDLGLLHELDEHYDLAEAAFRQALAVQDQLCRRNPAVSDFGIEWGSSMNNLGNVALKRGKPAEALECFERACRTFDAVLRQEPHQYDAQRFQKAGRQGLATALTKLGRRAEAAAIWKLLPEDWLNAQDKKLRAEAYAAAVARDN
jgi:serine/threonine protein kinase/tetratricopeptide (TPR) repeat protein